MRVIWGVVLLLSFAVCLPAQAPLTEQRIIEMFLERNVEVQAARHNIQLAKAEQIAARLRPNPTVTVIVENVESGSGSVNVAMCDKGLSR